MSKLRKLTELLTPPPLRRSKERPAPEELTREPALQLTGDISKPLKRLLAAPSMEAPDVREAVAEIKARAMQTGLYHTAFVLKADLDAMRWVDKDGRKLHKGRGYLLAADFILAHIKRELEDFASQGRPLGPNIFETYCNELIGCLLHGERPQRSIEIPAILIDDLFGKVLDTPALEAKFLEFAHRAAKSLLNSVGPRLRPDDALEEGRLSRAPALHPDRPSLETSVEPEAVGLVEQILDAVEAIIRVAPAAPSAAPGPHEAAWRRRPVLEAARAAGYLPFEAQIKQRLAVQKAAPEEARALFGETGDLWERQGDREHELRLTKLSARRYELAAQAFQRAGMAGRAADVEKKRVMGAR